MIGWVMLVGMMAAAFLLMLLAGAPRAMASFVGAALMLGAAGYALQGRPDQPGAPVEPAAKTGSVDPGLSRLRLEFFGRYTVAEPYFFAGEALTRSGALQSSVSLYLGAANAYPDSAALWTALGQAYAEHDGNTVSPASRFAFDRAMRLAPDHPGPPFFLGIALVRAGEFREAQRWWRRAYALASPARAYRGEIGRRLELLDAFLSSPAGRTAR
ncbi:tetratricopeptide repeat protein [Sphingomonas sp.]|uniref:tetratricopeptide repeat protein n=1 Tax=Sphingomonas sp. TaxID=28214 RepID=UPI002DD6648D|nr:hypothetical protein [Sphingomonas sp.]